MRGVRVGVWTVAILVLLLRSGNVASSYEGLVQAAETELVAFVGWGDDAPEKTRALEKTLARAIRLPSDARMMAPSILASSERRCGVKAASSRNPPEQMLSTSGPSPKTMRPPRPDCRTRSRPSRSGVPGATWVRARAIAPSSPNSIAAS